MSRGRSLKEHDLPVQMAGASAAVVNVTGGGGTSTNADTVDGYHAAAVPTAGRLLALDAAARFPASVIDWASVAGVGLQESPADKLAVKLDTNSGLSVSASGLKLSFAGGNPTAIEPDDAAGQGTQPYAARADHRHAIACAAPTTNLSVTSANAEGSATSFARADHTHAITSSANPGAAASILASSASGYLQLVRLGLGVAPSYPLQVQGTTPQLRLQQDASHYADFEVDAGGDLTIQPSGDSLLVPAGKTLASANWVSQTTGWGIYPESTYGRDGYADFRYIYADELHVKAFITDLEQALAGGQIISKSVAIIAEDFTVPAKGDGAFLTVEDLPGTTAYVFATGDWVRVRNISRDGGGLVVADAYGTVTQVSQNGDGTQTYAFWRAAADTGSAVAGTVIKKGGLALDYGVSGNGYWEVTTLDPAGSPYAQVATWATHPQNQTVRVRLGNLDGIAGIGAEWGLWAGKDNTHYIKISDARAEIKGLKQTWIDAGGNTRGMVDPTATGSNYLFWLGPSSGDKRFGVTADGTVYIGNVPSQNVAGWAHTSDLTKIDGGDIYTGSITADKVFVTGQNLLANGGFEFGSQGWTGYAGGPSTYDGPRTGAYHWWVNGDNAIDYPAISDFIPVDGGATYWGEAWLKQYAGSGSAGFIVEQYNKDKLWLSNLSAYIGVTGAYSRCAKSFTLAGNCCYVCIVLWKSGSLGTGSSIWWDDIVFRRMSENMLVVGNPSGARVEVNPAGIEGYSDSTTKQFYLRTDNGRAMFGGGEGVLDASGLVLSGDETNYVSYNAIRWMTQTNPAPGGNEVARISAGLQYPIGGSNYPLMEVVANEGRSYARSNLINRANSGTYGNFAMLSLGGDSTSPWASLGASIGHQTMAGVSVSGNPREVYFITNLTRRATISDTGLDVAGVITSSGQVNGLHPHFILPAEMLPSKTLTGSYQPVVYWIQNWDDVFQTITGQSFSSMTGWSLYWVVPIRFQTYPTHVRGALYRYSSGAWSYHPYTYVKSAYAIGINYVAFGPWPLTGTYSIGGTENELRLSVESGASAKTVGPEEGGTAYLLFRRD